MATLPVPALPLPARHNSRRSTPRVEILGLLHGYIVSLNLSFLVRDIGAGGFAVESPIAFPRGVVHEFRLTGKNGDAVHVSARVMYCRANVGGTLPFVAGFQFQPSPDGGAAIDRLMDAATSVLEFP